MQLALTDTFRAKWTGMIHDEWVRSVLRDRPGLKPEQLQRTRDLMDAHVRDCLITGYEDLIPALTLPDPGDRHVLAAAIKGGVNVIVTLNLKDFPLATLSPYGIEAQHPDEFVTHLLSLNPGAVCEAAKRQRASLKNPPKTAEEYLDGLARTGLNQTMVGLLGYINVI